MTEYLHADGWNIPEIDLQPIEPQPASPGMQAVLRSYAVGAVHEQGLWTPLLWSALESDEMYQALLAQLVLTNNLTRQATLYLPDHAWVWRRYNAVLQRPEIGTDGQHSDFFLRNFVIRATNLVLAA